jgi:hypothetical protein
MKIRFQFTQQGRFRYQNQPVFFLNACQFLRIRRQITRVPQSFLRFINLCSGWFSYLFLFHFTCEPNKISTYLNLLCTTYFGQVSHHCHQNGNRIDQRVYLGPEARLLDLLGSKDITVSVIFFLLQPYLKANNKPFSPFEPTPQ